MRKPTHTGQQSKCVKCFESVTDATGGYCHKFGVALTFENGNVFADNVCDYAICDGKKLMIGENQ